MGVLEEGRDKCIEIRADWTKFLLCLQLFSQQATILRETFGPELKERLLQTDVPIAHVCTKQSNLPPRLHQSFDFEGTIIESIE
jgi:hypothetical protein